jgi:hypothetical protein
LVNYDAYEIHLPESSGGAWDPAYVAALVGEDEEGVAGGGGAELIGGELLEAVEGFAHVAGIEGEEDFEGGAGEI